MASYGQPVWALLSQKPEPDVQDSHRSAAKMWMEGQIDLRRRLAEIEGAAQAAPEWFALRDECLTASSFFKAIGYGVFFIVMCQGHDVLTVHLVRSMTRTAMPCDLSRRGKWVGTTAKSDCLPPITACDGH